MKTQNEINQQIIPYREDALRWHLIHNASFWSEDAIQRVLEDINAVNNGTKELTDMIAGSNEGITIAEMLEDLKIDYNTELV